MSGSDVDKATRGYIGHQFGPLTVLGRVPGFRKRWLCRCTCGAELEAEERHFATFKCRHAEHQRGDKGRWIAPPTQSIAARNVKIIQLFKGRNFTYREIGHRFGITRAAVAGVVYRYLHGKKK